MCAWYYAEKSNISNKKLWRVYLLTGFELLLKTDYFTYGEDRFWVQPFRSDRWTWVEKEVRVVYLGMGAEFFLKSLYLKKGYSIRQIDSQKIFFEEKKIDNKSVFVDRSISFQQMIEEKNLKLILSDEEIKGSKEGFKIIQRWRNATLHSVRLYNIQTDKEYRRIMECLNVLYNSLIKSEKQMLREIKKIVTPWLKDRYPDGKFMKTEPREGKGVFLQSPLNPYAKPKKMHKVDLEFSKALENKFKG